jgi:hypothetical protein
MTKKILLFLAVVALAVLILFLTGSPIFAPKTAPAKNTNQVIKVEIKIEGLANSPWQIEVSPNTTLLTALENLNQTNPEIKLKTKNYGDMGVLVEQLGDSANGQDEKYWQYFVNAVQPMVGADKYILNNNDQVEWKFAKSSF